MIAHVLKYRNWNKIEMSFAFFLIAVLVSEIAVIFLLGHGSGEAMSKTFASMVAMGLSTLEQIWEWTYKMVGPMVFPLVMLTGVEIWAIYKLARCWKRKIVNDNPIKQYKVLEIVEGAAPGFGFLGTCISLIFTMSRMDPSLSQSAMLKVLLNNASSAFGSTVFGITLAITAFLVKELFKEFLIKSDANEKSDGQPFEELCEASSMNLIRREA